MSKSEIYSGIFFPPEAVDEIRSYLADEGIDVQGYDKNIQTPHVTYEFKGETMKEYFGEVAEVKITGYASGTPNDSEFTGSIEAVSVEVSFPNAPYLETAFEGQEAFRNETCGRENGFDLHITLSLEGDITPVEAGYLEFEMLPEDKQIILEGGTFGGFYPNNIDIGTEKEYSDLNFDIRDDTDVFDADIEIEISLDDIDNFEEDNESYFDN